MDFIKAAITGRDYLVFLFYYVVGVCGELGVSAPHLQH